MDSSGGLRAFEDKRWTERPQVVVWRHRAALELVRHEPVLDIGGGDGLFLELLRQRGFRDLQAAEISQVGAERIRARGFSVHSVDVAKPLPFEDDSFGSVCALDVLEHLYDPLSTLKEMARVGRDVIVAVPNFNYWRDRVRMVLGRIPLESQPHKGHVHWFNLKVLRDLIAEAKLEVDRMDCHPFTRLGPVGRWLAAIRPSLFGVSYAVRLVPLRP